MKKKLFAAVLLAGTMTLNAQVFNAGFENNNGTPLSAFSKINADGLTVPFYASILDFDSEAWIQYYDGFDNKIAMSTSWYDPAGQSNDWLITPKISIPATGNPTLYWKAKSYDFEKMDDYEIRISTTDNQTTSFATALTIVDEQPYDFNSRTLDLSAYKGKDIYIAFVNNTNDGIYLALDDLYISNSSNCQMPDLGAATVTNLTENSFTVNWDATAGINSYETGLTNFIIPVSSSGIQSALSKSYSGLQPATRYQFFLKNADCGSGWTSPKSVWTAALPPYSYDFEHTSENYGEYDSDGWTSTTWINGSGSAAQNGSGYVFSNTSKSYAKNDWIFSYPIKLNAGEKLTVKYFVQLGNTSATPATLKISVADQPDKANILQELSSQTVSGGAYAEYSSTFTPATSGVYYFGFGNTTPIVAVNAALRLDNIRFTTENILATSENNLTKIRVYPNPVKELLTIVSDEKILKAEIYSAEGRLIKSEVKTKTLDFSTLSKGVYFVKIYTESGVRTEKVIK